MSNGSATPETTFGYLSVIESPDHGYFGGYLIVSALGRPHEFHCTAPVRPSRAQRILYGPTLEPYLLGDQIACALLDVAKLTPQLILADCEGTLHVRSRRNIPMVLLCGRARSLVENSPQSENPTGPPSASTTKHGLFARTADLPSLFTVSSHDFQLPIGYETEQEAVTHLLSELGRQVDLVEPFDRIEEAIREAQRLGGRSVENHVEAA